MTERKYSLHRNEAGGFTITFSNGERYSGNLKDIQAMLGVTTPRESLHREFMRCMVGAEPTPSMSYSGTATFTARPWETISPTFTPQFISEEEEIPIDGEDDE